MDSINLGAFGLIAALIIFSVYHETQRSRVRRLESRIQSLLQVASHWRDEAANGYLYRAERGDIRAMLALASHYKNGADSRMNVAKVAVKSGTDYNEAMRWYLKAAESGNAVAMFSIGYMYHKGITPDLRENKDSAILWYQRALAAGFDPREGTDWLEKAQKGL